MRYMLDNGLCGDRELVVVSTTPERAHKEQAFCREHYPEANVWIIPDVSRQVKSAWASAEYIFRSEESFPYRKKKGQKYICLSYYPISLKNDCYDSRTAHLGYRAQLTPATDMLMSSSLINSQMDAAAFEIPFYKFQPIGKVRTDVLSQQCDVHFVRDYLQQLGGDYEFSKVILYTPTHRDYENATFDIKRSILGFDVEQTRFVKFLKENKLLIVCKLHPHQNAAVVNMELPNGVVNFRGAEDFGLVELMQASDMLMTDYTSAYVDYLMLDKPVIFNFYDLELYEKSRGLSFYPYERICAGERFTNEESFYKAVTDTLANPDKYAQMRADILDEMITYRGNVCEKTYKVVFGDKA
ncbi:MAG: CDP-glycerol glycerophosphotransferase family protein [Paludibacteraceae bacterium]|nr:CDP-glycerol glycerophosphotransferase family protein [Paludibacteraceae bacterium]